MAKIPFPAGVMITRSDLEMVHPGQVVLRSIYGAGSQVLGRGPGHWRGGSRSPRRTAVRTTSAARWRRSCRGCGAR